MAALIAYAASRVLFAPNFGFLSGSNSLMDWQSKPKMVSKDVSFLSIIEDSMPTMTYLQLEDLYRFITQHRQIECSEWQRLGNQSDGGWDVCFESPFDIRQVSGRPCVAFSFGINYVFEFDDVLAEQYGCKVYMFDPSMKKLGNHQRKRTSWFYKFGLGPRNVDMSSNGWKMRSLCTLFKQFGYESSTIDILKIDIDFWEWESFDVALREGCLTRVRQLMFESHTKINISDFTKPDYKRSLKIWVGLFKSGFRTWRWHKNPFSVYYKSVRGDEMACCYEHYMLNVRFI